MTASTGAITMQSRARIETRRIAGSFSLDRFADTNVRTSSFARPRNFHNGSSASRAWAKKRTLCRQLAQESNCQNVRFLGHLTAAQLGEEMRQAQLFFHPSEIEGHPQVLAQAAACGLPCIARSSYHPDYVIDGVTGLLAGSDDELGEALSRLIGDANLRHRMSAAAIEHAAKFEWDGVAEQWSEILEKAVAGRRNAQRQIQA